jgi:hypothetical protein
MQILGRGKEGWRMVVVWKFILLKFYYNDLSIVWILCWILSIGGDVRGWSYPVEPVRSSSSQLTGPVSKTGSINGNNRARPPPPPQFMEVNPILQNCVS